MGAAYLASPSTLRPPPLIFQLMAAIHIIAAPYHAGARNVRVGAGPTRLLEDGLESALQDRGLSTRLEIVPPVDDFEGEIGQTFEVKRRVAAAVAEARSEGAFSLVLAGNCNTTVGVWAGLGAPDETGLVWFDAHPDFDTPDEHRSGYLDGMGVATLAGQAWRNLVATLPGFRPFALERMLYCGIRDFEPGQLEKVCAAGIRAVAGSKEQGADYLAGIADALSSFPVAEVMIHLDVDCLDTSVGIANEYAAPGGLGAKELLACLDHVCGRVRPLSLTVASFNPSLEGSERISQAAIAAAVRVAKAAVAA
jgi:arginase